MAIEQDVLSILIIISLIIAVIAKRNGQTFMERVKEMWGSLKPERGEVVNVG